MTLASHEDAYRPKGWIEALNRQPIIICGIGALGSHIAVNLGSIGCRSLVIVDRDRVEEKNLANQVYIEESIGKFKTMALADILWAKWQIDCEEKKLDLNVSSLGKLPSGLIVDCFDNSQSRGFMYSVGLPDAGGHIGKHIVLHCGVDGDFGEIKWNDKYTVPKDRGRRDICDHPLARNFCTLIASLASEVIIRYTLENVKENLEITFRDYHITRFL